MINESKAQILFLKKKKNFFFPIRFLQETENKVKVFEKVQQPAF
jgi:hypothetical protein